MVSRSHAVAPRAAPQIESAPPAPLPGPLAMAAGLGDLAQAAGFLVRRLHNQFVADWPVAPAGDGPAITPVQGGMLILIDGNPGITQTALSRLLAVEPPTLVQALRPLVERGLVERRRNPTDARTSALHLKPAGQDAMAQVRAGIPAHEEQVLARLSADEQRQLRALLRRALGLD